MLQAASTHLIIPEPSEDLLTNEPWSIELYADGLMDELFADIDEILDASVSLPSQTARHGNRTPRRSPEETTAREWFYKPGNYSRPITTEYESVQTVNVPQIVLPSTLTQVRNKQAQGQVVVDNPGARAISTRREQTRRALRKLLVLGTTIGVAIAGTIYLFQSGILLLLTSKLTQPQTLYVPQMQLPTKVDVEAELVDYMLGALAIIDKQNATNNQQSVRPGLTNRLASNSNAIAFAGNQPVGNLPPPLAANNTPLTPNRSGNVVERIYIPIYQAPSPMRYAPPAIPGTPTLLPPVATNSKTSQPDVVKTALNTVKQAAKPVGVNMLAAVRGELKPLSVRTAPITVKQPPNPLPALPVVPLRVASPTLPTTTAPTQSVTQQQAYLPTTTAAVPTHTLEGLLELGNKSAALFQVDGVTRRINIGEGIGSSGWTLVDVSNGEAIVRRNGEVRSIYAGQKL
ncbi:hypothetical protein I8751_09775 [Nostocaceae cyanobacterium CENA357]|uniref:Type II secretion system protein GspC N-terminal domain-containing protein n=1 Tax=Atlanticothrix silvestris CENA357 TaxID=1725252 RepID=A0A8J7L242_9CYAN|nr:hypothetical protein [Atlanticothrix silvestris]MBH8552656.1 hypothetical protein [Atlanticothrix silvestris CENA357]